MNKDLVQKLEQTLANDFRAVSEAVLRIRGVLESKADSKSLKGDELVGWLGEVYGKLFYDGTLVDEQQEHDFVDKIGRRISVKARRDRGNGASWKRSSGIPRIKGKDCPTHLLFVRLSEDYRVKDMWLYDWKALLKAGRFKSHKVRGEHRAYYFSVKVRLDKGNLEYSEPVSSSRASSDQRGLQYLT